MVLWKKRIANSGLAVKFIRQLTNDYVHNGTVKKLWSKHDLIVNGTDFELQLSHKVRFWKILTGFLQEVVLLGATCVPIVSRKVTANAAPSLSKDVCMKSCFVEDDSDAKT